MTTTTILPTCCFGLPGRKYTSSKILGNRSSTRISVIAIILKRNLLALFHRFLIVSYWSASVTSFTPLQSKTFHHRSDRKQLSFNSYSGSILSEEWGRNMANAGMETKSSTSNMMPPLEDLQKVLAVAVDASRTAGVIIREHAGGAQVSERKANSRDLLTIVDPLCEKTIKEKVLGTFPHHEFLGEEMVAPGADASKAALDLALNSSKTDWLWIVDPIDGTTNFVHGMPLCMPSVAVSYKGQVVVGVIYDPHRDELFSAIRGQGAYLNQKQPIKVGLQEDIGDAVVAMGSPPAIESLQMSLKGVAALMPKVRTIRMLGSAALMLAWVACGRCVVSASCIYERIPFGEHTLSSLFRFTIICLNRLTAYWEFDLSSWDIAAGALLIEEAGGKFTDLSNQPYHLVTRKIIGSNGLVHESILKELNDAGVK